MNGTLTSVIRPALVFEDAELDNAVEHTSTSFLRNSGQICFASSRVLIQESIADKYIEKVKASMEAAEKKMGDPSKAETVYGPLADKKQFDRVMSFIQGAKDEGTQILTGGERQGDKGTFVKPTVFLNPDLKSKVYTDEIFGPAITIRTFKDEEEAVKLANDTTYGLGCKSSPPSQPPQSLPHPLTDFFHSNPLHLRHLPRSPRRRPNRSRHRRHQLRFRHVRANAFRRLQAERYR